MRQPLVGVLMVVFGITSARAAAVAAVVVGHAPLAVDYVARLWEGQKDLPLVTVGRLAEGAKSPVVRGGMERAYYGAFRNNQMGKDEKVDPNAEDFARGKMKLRPAMEGEEVVVAVAIPGLSDGWATIGPVVLEGKTLTVSIDQWRHDNTADSAVRSSRKVQMLYLPPLAGGEYRLRVEWRVMSPALTQDGSDYAWTESKVAEVGFAVEAVKQVHPRAEAASILFSALRAVEVQPKADGPMRVQVPWDLTAWAFSNIGDATEGVIAGRFAGDPFTFLRGDTGRAHPVPLLPKLEVAVSNDSTYVRMIGPMLNSGEWASVESIRWNGDTVTIDCDLWTDTAGRDKNLRSHPMLLVRLNPPGHRPALLPITPPGNYKVEVRWHKLVAPETGRWYAEESQREGAVEFVVK